jgi:peptidoglycan/LPS O-acetylase OafA/YrhL
MIGDAVKAVPSSNKGIDLVPDKTLSHLAPLDALRALAALMVALGHSFIAMTFDGVDKLWITPIWLLESDKALFAKLVLFVGNGAAAVTVFFVLSGVVLGLSLDRDYSITRHSCCRFLIKRAFRIYPPPYCCFAMHRCFSRFFQSNQPRDI